MYKNYLFDLYGTLVDIRTDEENGYLWEKLCTLYGFYGAYYTPPALKDAYQKEVQAETQATKAAYPQYTHIEVRLENVFFTLYKNRGVVANRQLVDYTAQFFRAISTSHVRLYDGVLDLLDALNNAGKKKYLLTNAQRCFTMPELTLLKIADRFDGIVISSNEYTKKPDKAFYHIILKRYGLNPAESIMIGNDCITDIKGAHDAGLDSLYIHSNLSPEITKPLPCTYHIVDGDVCQSKKLVL